MRCQKKTAGQSTKCLHRVKNMEHLLNSLLGAFTGRGGSKEKPKLVYVEKIQPSGRVICEWPTTKEAMLEAIASKGSNQFLTDAEMEEIDKSVKEKLALEQRERELMEKYSLPAGVIDSFIFRHALAMFNAGKSCSQTTGELSPLFRNRWLPIRIGEHELVKLKADGLRTLSEELLSHVWHHLREAVDDLSSPPPSQPSCSMMLSTCQSIVNRLLDPKIDIPPDTVWRDQLKSVYTAVYPLQTRDENAALLSRFQTAFQSACEKHSTEICWTIPEMIITDKYVRLSGLWRDQLDIVFVATECTSLSMITLFNNPVDPAWVVLPSVGTYTRARGYAHHRAWLSDPQFLITANALAVANNTFSAAEWQRALLSSVVQLELWSENDVSDA